MKQLFAICALVSALSIAAPALAEQQACADVAGRGQLNVLTINILYTDFAGRRERLQEVADFILAQDENSDPVDVILLQEVVSGGLAATPSLALNLSAMLSREGLRYNLRLRPVTGLPGVFMVGNAILSRCAITEFASRLLPYAPERPLGGPGFPILHEVQMAGITIPGYGAASVYNTHLCAFCSGDDRLRQTQGLFRFLNRRDEDNASRLIVLGGDFNTDVAVAADQPAYGLITEENGFTDTYAEANGCTGCCSEADTAGCTYAVPGNSLVSGAPPVRIDYIFARGDFSTLESAVVFDEAPWVSDHSGVLSKIGLP